MNQKETSTNIVSISYTSFKFVCNEECIGFTVMNVFLILYMCTQYPIENLLESLTSCMMQVGCGWCLREVMF